MKKRICAAALSACLLGSMALNTAALNVDQARELLGEYYIHPLNEAAQQASTLEELFSSLNDPYTVYYTAEEREAFLTFVNGEQVTGIGVSILKTFDDGFHLLSVLPDSPAREAGLVAGDVIIAVDGVNVTAEEDITARITGEEGTQVTVTVRRADGTCADFTMTRRMVQIPLVAFEALNDVGYFECASFGDSTPMELSIPLSANEKNVTVWAMDLRGNPGGDSDSAALAVSHFVGGREMAIFRDGQNRYYATQTSYLNIDRTDKPLIVLSGPSTASAAELFSGAIRDHGAGIAIGQRTFGKGSAQILLDASAYPDIFTDDCIKVTAYQFYSPDGLTCNLVGVLPTLMIADEHLPAVAQLLSAPVPYVAHDMAKLELAGQTFYLRAEDCRKAPEATRALLEALPPAARLYRGFASSNWEQQTPESAARWLGTSCSSRSFADVKTSPYRTAIDTLACYGLIAGDEKGNFLPEQSITRGELAAMLATAFQLPAADDLPFTDVSPDAWYAGGISALASLGFVSGTGADTFHPDRAVTNQELYTVLDAISRWVSTLGSAAAEKPYPAVQWLDYYRYPDWAQLPTRNLYSLGINVDRENPDAAVSRGACAQAVYELMGTLGMFWY